MCLSGPRKASPARWEYVEGSDRREAIKIKEGLEGRQFLEKEHADGKKGILL